MTPFEIARASLRDNIQNLPSGKYLSAGQNQFLTLWTRDFCHSVKGLLIIGERGVAESHLKLLLQNLREDGLVPRVMDNIPVQLRVSWQAIRRRLRFLPHLAFKEPLKPQYEDEHGSCAYDSNLLLLLAAFEMGEEFIIAHKNNLLKVWHWYDHKFDRGLLRQSAFSDWQDTTRREGRSFLLNLFYIMVGSRYEKIGFAPKCPLLAISKEMKNVFLKDDLFISLEGYPQVSVEGNLFALQEDHILSAPEKTQLWSKLKMHPLLTLDEGIGRCSYPDWPKSDLAFHIKLANLHRYHGSLSWSWLMGLGLLAARSMGDGDYVDLQVKRISEILKRDGEVFEVFDPENGMKPWSSWLIGAEHPFAWGASYLCQALAPK